MAQANGSRERWLRAAVLGANDGITSTASLLVGMLSSEASAAAVLTAGLAGLVAGAASMAAGEFVSVASQRDLEDATLATAQARVAARPNVAVTEIAVGLQLEGVDPGLARRAAEQVTQADPLASYARHELGLVEERRARPLPAALASAASFVAGGVWPVLGLLGPTRATQSAAVVTLALVALAVAGAMSADVGGASRRRAALRVTLGGGVAMGLSAVIGRVVGAVL